MSIVASVKVYDGVVIGAESMTQLTVNVGGKPQFVKSYRHAQKIFQIADYPMGALTYGGGNIGNRSMESFVHEFSISERKDPDLDKKVGSVAKRLLAFLRGFYDAAFRDVEQPERPVIGFLIAGYSPEEPLASEWEFILPHHQEPVRVREKETVGASWRGIGVPFTRLFFGVDPRVDQILTTIGVSKENIAKFHQIAKEQLTSKVAFDGMPIQDAIDFCKFILDTTIGTSTYELGVPTCGGPVNLAVIGRQGFKWVSHPKFILSSQGQG